MEEKLLKAGELAKLVGVSIRTIRFYDKKGLLKPVSYTDAGYRLYDSSSLEILQRILMLKYVGFSLEQIESIINSSSMSGQYSGLRESFTLQKQLLQEKMKHLQRVLEAVEEAESAEEDKLWEMLIYIISITSEKEMIDRQYQNDGNLQKRINLHAYSTAKQAWTQWVFERLQLKPGMKILEIGCGNGLLWLENLEQLPGNLDMLLTDNSEGMLEKARQALEGREEVISKNINLHFAVKDAENIELTEKGYDVIIANHMLYHVKNTAGLLDKVADALADDGTFYSSTVGNSHMRELNDLVNEFDPEIDVPLLNIIKGFNLENGREQLLKYFEEVRTEIQDNDLLVDNVDSIFNYVYSYPGNAALVLKEKEREFKNVIAERIKKEGKMYIHKSSGIFISRKAHKVKQ